MTKYKIVTMPGDGIGKVVLNEAIRVLDAVGFDADYIHGDIGWEFWKNEGNALPERTLELLEKYKIGLFGAITSKPKDQAAKELSPELKEKDYVCKSRYERAVCVVGDLRSQYIRKTKERGSKLDAAYSKKPPERYEQYFMGLRLKNRSLFKDVIYEFYNA